MTRRSSADDSDPRSAAMQIWKAGVDAVQSDVLVERAIHATAARIEIGPWSCPSDDVTRIMVLGGGKAGAGMAVGLERALAGTPLAARLEGWLNVPADCVRDAGRIHLHAGRPAGINEPTEAGLEGSREILRRAAALGSGDLCLVLLSGGGSALLPAPRHGISLADLQSVTRLLMMNGATINNLNLVRRHLSDIKGGGLMRACAAEHRLTLVISDVIGNPLDVIASGPTFPSQDSPRDALELLEQFDPDHSRVPDSVWHVLDSPADPGASLENPFEHVIVGENRDALDAAAARASQLGYEVISLGCEQQGIACQVGVELAEKALKLKATTDKHVCVLSGGEPVVHLAADARRGRGGRNQELVLAALGRLLEDSADGIAVLSGGTDGEDGPTDAAGAVVDTQMARQVLEQSLDIHDALARNDSYPLLDSCGALIRTGPTHTNVMDLRVVIVHPDGVRT